MFELESEKLVVLPMRLETDASVVQANLAAQAAVAVFFATNNLIQANFGQANNISFF